MRRVAADHSRAPPPPQPVGRCPTCSMRHPFGAEITAQRHGSWHLARGADAFARLRQRLRSHQLWFTAFSLFAATFEAMPWQPRRVLPARWRIHHGRDPERELRSLRCRFRAVSRRYERAVVLRRLRHRAGRWALGAGAAVVLYVGLNSLSPWPLTVTLRHVAAAPNCNAARAVGLASARKGQPGYWPSHDRAATALHANRGGGVSMLHQARYRRPCPTPCRARSCTWQA